MATEVQVFYNLKSQDIPVTGNIQGLEAPTLPMTSFPHQSRDLTRKVISAAISLHPYHTSYFLLTCLPLTQPHVTDPWRRKSGGVKKKWERQNALESDLNIH